ncbi:MAG: hypothetical protein QNJ47_13110 [Nostocaceae cyanobacterium]|nr:hypothetical protein [Nostocaceae cyanobacterium]
MLKKVLLPTVTVSLTLFGSFGLLLALQGSKPVQIDLEKEQIFSGKLGDLLPLPVLTVISLGAGVSSGVVVGWKNSLSKSSELKKQVSHLNTLISEKDSQIEEFKLSPWNLRQLNSFLDEEESKSSINTSVPVLHNREVIAGYGQDEKIQTLTYSEIATDTKANNNSITVHQYDSNQEEKPPVLPTTQPNTTTQATWIQMSTAVTEPLTIANPSLEIEEETSKKSPVRSAVAGFPAAQFAMGMTKGG